VYIGDLLTRFSKKLSAWTTLKWRQETPPKRPKQIICQHGVTSQKFVLLKFQFIFSKPRPLPRIMLFHGEKILVAA
jgi:hypothetical protein